MKFSIKGPIKENIPNLGRRIGYHFLRKNGEEYEFARPHRGYPRFHLFITTKGDSLDFSLHLDQKKPVYENVSAHSGEYEGNVVEKEAESVKKSMERL